MLASCLISVGGGVSYPFELGFTLWLASIVLGASRMVLTLDASESWGCGAFASEEQWFQLQLPACWDWVHITVRKFLPIELGVAVWGSRWNGLTVTCRYDNAAVVAIVNSGRSKTDRAMYLIRCLSFLLAKWGGALTMQTYP